MPLALKVPLQRLCTVCLATVTYFAINLGYFFPVRGLNNLVFDSGNNALHVQTVPCCYREQQQLPAKPQLSLHSHLGLVPQQAPGFGKYQELIRDALGLPKGATASPAQTPSHSSCNSLCNFSVTTRGRSQALLQTGSTRLGTTTSV